jgi:hypothetical protein
VKGLWRDIEFFCPVCQEWRPSGAAATQASFASDDNLTEGQHRFPLTCGHEITATEDQARLGSELERPD